MNKFVQIFKVGLFLLLITLPISTFAQDGSENTQYDADYWNKKVGLTDKGSSSTSTQIVSSQTVSLTDLKFDSLLPYNGGDTVKVSFKFINHDAVDYQDVYIVPKIVHLDKSNRATGVYGQSTTKGPYFVSRDSMRDIDFDYTLPKLGEVGHNLLSVDVQTGAGVVIGQINGDIRIENLLTPVQSLVNFVRNGDKYYDLEDGPTVDQGTAPTLVSVFKGLSDKNVTLQPHISVYDTEPSRPILYDSDSANSIKPSSFNITAGKIATTTIQMPTFEKPGVYLAQVYFTDADGNDRASTINVRWIVNGPMVTFSAVSSDKTAVSKGDDISVDVVYTGAPVNIDTGESYDVGSGQVSIKVYNESNDLILSANNDVNFSTIGDHIVFTGKSLKSANSIHVVLVATKDGKELARYESNLTNPDVTRDQGLMSRVISQILSNYIYLGLMILLVMILILFFVKKRISKKTMYYMLTLAIVSGAGLTYLIHDNVSAETRFLKQTYAQICGARNNNCRGYYYTAAYLSSNVSKLRFEPGESMNSSLTFNAYAHICNNTDMITNAHYYMYDLQGNLVQDYGLSRLITYAGNAGGDYHKHFDYNTIAYFPNGTNIPNNPIKAPLKPGTYGLRADISVQGYFNCREEYEIYEEAPGSRIRVATGRFASRDLDGDCTRMMGPTTYWYTITVVDDNPLQLTCSYETEFGQTAGRVGMTADGKVVPANVTWTMHPTGGSGNYTYYWHDTTATQPDWNPGVTYANSPSITRSYNTTGLKTMYAAVVDNVTGENTNIIYPLPSPSPYYGAWGKSCGTVNVVSGSPVCMGPYNISSTCISSTTKREINSTCNTQQDTVCPAGTSCTGGECTTCGSEASSYCDGDFAVKKDASCNISRKNCALSNKMCVAGECVSTNVNSCPANQSVCGGTCCDGTCTNNVCVRCVGSNCGGGGGGSCSPGQTVCGTSCCNGSCSPSGTSCSNGPTGGTGGIPGLITTFKMDPDTVYQGGKCTMHYEATGDICVITSTDLAYGSNTLDLDSDGYIKSESQTAVTNQTQTYTLTCSGGATNASVSVSKSARCYINGSLIEH